MDLRLRWDWVASVTMVAVAGVTTGGCETRVYNNSQVSGTVTFSGYTRTPNDVVNARVRYKPWAPGQPYYNLGSALTGSTVVTTDCKGVNWYQWNFNYDLGNQMYDQYMTSGSPGYNLIKVKFDEQAFGVDVTTFESDFMDCAQAYCDPIDIMGNCHSPQSPVLTLSVPCGGDWLPVCHGKDSCAHSGFISTHYGFCNFNTWTQQQYYYDDGTYPSDQQKDYTQHVQGTASDGTYWYVTQDLDTGDQSVLWKVPFNVNWNADWSSPPYWRALESVVHTGCGHWGDPDVYNGVVYVPLEPQGGQGGCGGTPKIAAFSASTLQLLGPPVAVHTRNAPWVAINPMNGRLYLSDFGDNKDAGDPSVKCLYVYDISWPSGQFALTPHVSEGGGGTDANCIPLFNPDHTVNLYRIQGGAFSSTGKLYLSSDSYYTLDDPVQMSGLHGINVGPSAGTYMFRRDVAVDHSWDIGQEIEGISVQDWSGVDNGNIHVAVLGGEDNNYLWLHHYHPPLGNQ